MRVVRYLKGCPGLGIKIVANKDAQLECYVDADWGTCPDTRRSVTGYVVKFGGSPISWKSKKQNTISKSSTEAEYRALSSVVLEIVWVKRLLEDLGFTNLKLVQLFCDIPFIICTPLRRRNKDKWVCEVRVPNGNTRIWLGTYSTVEMAARAHDVAALALRGKSACLNFADSAWRLPLPESTNAAEIRRVAALAAEEFGRSGDDFEVCSLSSTTADEEVIGDAPNVQDYCEEDEATYIYQNPAVSTRLDELRHLIVSMAEEPLRSPPPLRPYGWSWDDVEADTEVSLWQY
ncbi:dehydration-responsive element-binding protein 1C [Neltuma alba]|uniref:dehydration-responsive element-binding protein 1C n=1 Tax=Neltuma alba TaxID=207710 RepID=UPI0010A442A5|nr:dehydration-responsive element-binding protein 1C-like [Prosopis alba]